MLNKLIRLTAKNKIIFWCFFRGIFTQNKESRIISEDIIPERPVLYKESKKVRMDGKQDAFSELLYLIK